MHIVLDGAPLTVSTGGIRRYTEELAIALQGLNPHPQILATDVVTPPHQADQVYVVSDRPLQAADRLRTHGVVVADLPQTGMRKRWWSYGFTRVCHDLQATVVHGTDFSVPYLHRHPSVMTIHDLSPWRFPEWQPQAGRIRTRTPWMLRLGLADRVITVSEAVRKEAIAAFRLSADRVVAVPLAADSRFHPGGGQPLSALLGPNGPIPFLLFVGTLEPRKHVESLIAAWRALRQVVDIPLVLAGRLRDDGMAPHDDPGILWLPEPDDASIVWVYANATAVVYPSHYEGFGLPVLEAMQCGAPVVISKADALRELAGDAALSVDPADTLSFRDLLQALCINPDLRGDLRRRSLARASLYSWERTARLTRDVYLEAVAHFAK